MSKLMKGLAGILCLALLMSAAMTGCASSPTPSSQAPQSSAVSASSSQPAASANTSSEAAASSPSLAPVQLTYYFVGNWPQPGQDDVFAKLNEIAQQAINATVNWQPIGWSDYDSKMAMIDASAEAYDLCFTSNWTNNYLINVAKNAYLPLDDLLQTDAPQTYASIPPSWWKAVIVNGKIYGVPNQQIAARNTVICYNKNISDKYNLDMSGVKDLPSLEPILAQLIQQDPSIVAYAPSVGDTVNSFGQDDIVGAQTPGAVYFSDSACTVVNQFETPEVKNFFALMADWNQKGYIHGSQMMTVTDVTSMLMQSQIFAFTLGMYKPGGAQEQSAQYGVPIGNIQISNSYLTTGGITATLTAVSRNSKNPDRAMMLLELLNTDSDLINTITFGIEGVNYTLQSDSTVQLTDNSNYVNGNSWAFGNVYNTYLISGQDLSTWDQTKQLNTSAAVSPLLGFSFNVDPVKNEIAQCSIVINQYVTAFNYGTLSMDTDYPTFISKLKSAGSDTIIQEMQKQVNTWKAAQ